MNESPHSAETAAATDFAEKLYTEGILSTRQGRRQLETLMAYEPDFSLEWACQQMAFRAALAEEGDLLSAYAAICPRLARDLAQARAAGVPFEEYMAQHPASPAEEAEREEAAAGRKYYDIAATPLVFHQFIRFVVLPVNVLLSALELARYLQEAHTFLWVAGTDVAYLLGRILLASVAFVGFLSYRQYAYRAILGFAALNVLYQIAVFLELFFYACALASDMNVLWYTLYTQGFWNSFITALIWAFILRVYYHKRRRLFGGKKQ